MLAPDKHKLKPTLNSDCEKMWDSSLHSVLNKIYDFLVDVNHALSSKGTEYFEERDFRRVINRHKTWLDGKTFNIADLAYAQIDEVYAEGCMLPYSRFRKVKMNHVNFDKACLRRTKLKDCEINWADFRGANLTGVNETSLSGHEVNLGDGSELMNDFMDRRNRDRTINAPV